MINASQDYRDMMSSSPVLNSRMVITITNGDGDQYILYDKDIVSGSFAMNWRSSNNSTLSLGTCYSASLTFSAFQFIKTEIEGKMVMVYPSIIYKLPNNEEETIALGVFRCAEPKNFGRTTSYECYDLMLALDKQIPTRFVGTAYQCLDYICDKCGVELGNQSTEINNMPNGSTLLAVDPQRVGTYRDALSYIAIVLGGYAQFGRDGKLYIRHFHYESDMSLPRKRRIRSSFAGYKVQFQGIKARFLADQNFYPYEYLDPIVRNGTVLDVGDIPIIEGNEQVKHIVLARIYQGINRLEYYPCEITYVGDPTIEAGDMLTTPDKEGYNRKILLTSVVWNWRRESSLVSEGSNPQQGAVSTQAKKTSQTISAQSNALAVVTATYVNAGGISVGSESGTTVTSLRFVVNKDLTAIFGAEIPVYSTGDGYVKITYKNDGITGDVVRARVHAGYNLITLVNHIYYDSGSIVLLTLDAQTEPITEGGTAPTLTIYQNTIRSYVFAQGIETEVPWDGIITVSDEIPYIEQVLALYGITEGITIGSYDSLDNDLSAVVSAISMGVQVREISDTMTLEMIYGDQVIRCGWGQRAGMDRMLAPWSPSS